ncbi:MAG: ATP-dependent Clp protease ATP-binding subunit [Anaerolineae bacterium]|nr:ATP-dependent Clp protease ATP-binding subunit [Anaerolineae bacterium]
MELAIDTRRDSNGDLELLTDKGRAAQLSRQMIIALDEALSVAQALDEVYIGTDHLLAALTERQLGTAALLEQHGITKTAVHALMGHRTLVGAGVPASAEVKPRKSNTTLDHVALIRAGEATPVYLREALLRDLMNMIAQARTRHVILIGPDGVGKRTLVYSLAQLIANGQAPQGLHRLIQVQEEAFLDMSVEAMQIAIKQAGGGVLFVPHLGRFFGPPGRALYPKAGANLQKAFLGTDPVIIATTTQADWDQTLSKVAIITENSQILRVPEPSLEETRAILRVLQPNIATDYGISISDEALNSAADLARRYLGSPPLPRSAEHLLHRAAALIKLGGATGRRLQTPGQRYPAPGCRRRDAGRRANDRHPGQQTGRGRAHQICADGRAPARPHHWAGCSGYFCEPGRKKRTGGPQGPPAAYWLLPVHWPQRRRQNRACQSPGRIPVR